MDLVVTDVERSKQFYSELRGLGWTGELELEGERGETIWYLQAQDTWIGLREKQSDAHAVPYDRYAVGVHHVAFEALSRDAVDRCWEWVLSQEVGDGERSQGVPALRRGVLRDLLLRPGRDQARSRPRTNTSRDDLRLTGRRSPAT